MSLLTLSRLRRIISRMGVTFLASLPLLLSPGIARAQTAQKSPAPDLLHQLNSSIEALVQRVSPTVVQVQVTGYGSTQESNQGQTSLVISKQRSVGSGVIVDPEAIS